MELARTYREFVAGQIDRGQANTRTFMLMSLTRIIADHELEKRMDAIEARLRGEQPEGRVDDAADAD